MKVVKNYPNTVFECEECTKRFTYNYGDYRGNGGKESHGAWWIQVFDETCATHEEEGCCRE